MRPHTGYTPYTFVRATLLLLAVVGLVAGITVLAGCSGRDTPSGEPDPPTTVEPDPDPETDEPDMVEMPVTVCLMRGEKIGVVQRTVSAEQHANGSLQVVDLPEILTAKVESLLGPVSDDEAEWGMSTAIPQGTVLNSLRIDGGTVIVDLSEEFASGGGSLSMQARAAQVVYTVTDIEEAWVGDGDPLTRVVFEIDGDPVEALGGEGLIVSPFVKRADFDPVRPMIFVISPAPGATCSGQITLTGESNCFESTFLIEVRDADDNTVTEQLVTDGGGLGQWEPFSVPVEYEAEPGAGTLTVYEQSPQDGSRINEVRIPVTFE